MIKLTVTEKVNLIFFYRPKPDLKRTTSQAKADYLIRILSRYVRVHPVHICWHKEKKSTKQKLTISSDFSPGMLECIQYTFVGIKKKKSTKQKLTI
jgi:hypothetical protein